jgi:hypothetical protein
VLGRSGREMLSALAAGNEDVLAAMRGRGILAGSRGFG